jgi:hypothetical protein
VENMLEYHKVGARLLAPITFEGRSHQLPLDPLVATAKAALDGSNAAYKEDGLQVLMLTALTAFAEVSQQPCLLSRSRADIANRVLQTPKPIRPSL